MLHGTSFGKRQNDPLGPAVYSESLFFRYSIDGRFASKRMDANGRERYVFIAFFALCGHQGRRDPLNWSRQPAAANRLVWPNFGERLGPNVFRYAPDMLLAKDTHACMTDFYEPRRWQMFLSKAQCSIRCK